MENCDYFLLEKNENNYKLTLLNIWDKQTLPNIIKKIELVTLSKNTKLSIDFANLKECDSSAIIYLISFLNTFEEKNITILNNKNHEKIFDFYKKHYQTKLLEEEKKNLFFEDLGKKNYDIYKETKEFKRALLESLPSLCETTGWNCRIEGDKVQIFKTPEQLVKRLTK